MKTFLTLISLTFALTSYSQEEKVNTADNTEKVFTLVPIMPQLGDKEDTLQLYIQKVSNFPTSLSRTQQTKNVFVQVIIEKDGKVNFDKLMRGVNEKYDTEAIQITQNMPNWTPGHFENGKTVRTYLILPFWFE